MATAQRWRTTRKITIYRDDSTTPVVYENVKHIWYEGNNSVLVVSQYRGTGDEHDYFHWPVNRFQWFKDEKTLQDIPA